MRLCSLAETSSVTSSVVWSLRRNVKCRHAQRPHSCKLTFGFSLLVKRKWGGKNQDMTRMRLCYFEHIIGLRIPHNELRLIYNLIAIIYNNNWMLLSDKVAQILGSFLCRWRIFLFTGIFLDLIRRSRQQVLHQHKCFQPMPKVLFFYVLHWHHKSDLEIHVRFNSAH